MSVDGSLTELARNVLRYAMNIDHASDQIAHHGNTGKADAWRRVKANETIELAASIGALMRAAGVTAAQINDTAPVAPD